MADEQWWLFTRSEGVAPKIVTARHVEEPERTPRPFAVTARLPYRAQPNGLPEKGELDRVVRLEDKIIEALAPSEALHVGHVTGDGVLKVVLYSKEKAPDAITVKTGLLAKTAIDLDSRQDNEWSVYEHELAPTPLEREESYNRQLLATLAGHGDVASKSRPVDFAARFPTEANRQAFMDEMAGHGFLPSAEPTWEPEPDDFWCELVKDTSIEPETIGKLTALTRQIAAKNGGEFDGWACPVMK